MACRSALRNDSIRIKSARGRNGSSCTLLWQKAANLFFSLGLNGSLGMVVLNTLNSTVSNRSESTDEAIWIGSYDGDTAIRAG